MTTAMDDHEVCPLTTIWAKIHQILLLVWVERVREETIDWVKKYGFLDLVSGEHEIGFQKTMRVEYSLNSENRSMAQ